MTIEHRHKFIDPDPFTVAALGIAASSFVLQFVTAWRDWNKSPAGKSDTNQGQPTPQQFIALNHIQEQLSGAQSHMNNAIRSIERGSASADTELYDAKVRVSVTSINLEVHHHLQFSQNLGQAYGRIGNLSMFINNLTLHHPALAAELGRRIDSKVPGAADRLNAILAEGRETREALQETRQILDALEQSIKEIDNGN